MAQANELVMVCSRCKDSKQKTEEAELAGYKVTHGICPECFAVQMRIIEEVDIILNLNKEQC